MTLEELTLIENIVRTADKGKKNSLINKESYFQLQQKLSNITDLFQHILDEAMPLLPKGNRLKDKIQNR